MLPEVIELLPKTRANSWLNPVDLYFAWLKFAVVWAAVVSFEYVNLSAVATTKPVPVPPPAK